MQGSKIIVKKTYAIIDPNDIDNKRLVRFTVTAVVQRRIDATGSPHDYKTTVEGFIVEDRGTNKPDRILALSPDRILGPYEQQVELKAREDAEQAEEKRKREEAEDRKNRLVDLFYRITGIAKPDKESYSAIFHASYNRVSIDETGIKALLAVLEKEKAEC